MNNFRTIAAVFLTVTLLVLVGLSCGPEPTPTPTPSPPPPTATPAQPTPTAEGPVVVASPTPKEQSVKLASLAVFPEASDALRVLTTQPADGAEGVAVGADNARIVVQFNHPVVPLVSVEEQNELPSPISVEPAVEGEGQWLNTSTFEFTPSEDLRASTRYTVRVQAGLQDVLGADLAQDYTFSFRTAFPAVVTTQPAQDSRFAGVTQPISVTFNQPMDHGSAESAFSLTPRDGGPAVGGQFRWDAEQMAFLPSSPLAHATNYAATVAAGAQAATGEAVTQNPYTWTFSTVAAPAVESTEPSDGAEGADLGREGFTITFAGPMDPESLQVTIQPTITNQSAWWSDSDTVAHVVGGWEPSTAYTVSVEAESLSRYGDPLGDDIVLRFTTAPLDPRFRLITVSDMGVYNAYQTPRVFATATNLDRATFRLYGIDLEDFLELTGENRWRVWDDYSPPAANQLREWSLDAAAPLNATRQMSATLTADPAAQLDPGLYFIEAEGTGEGQTVSSDKHLLVVTQLNLALKRTDSEALVWATDLRSGQPVAGQPIALYDDKGNKLIEGTTDGDGVFRGSFARLEEPWRSTVAISEVNGRIVAAAGSDWQDGISPWEFDLSYTPVRQRYYATMYTDRPIYRPGQIVNFRGILRVDEGGQFSLPDVESVPITVRDSQGKELLNTELALTRFGTFSGEVELSPVSPTGFYQIEMMVGPEGPDRFYHSQGFQVAAYRRPDFQVQVSTGKSDYVQGETISVDVAASYFFGGPVAGGQVQWRLLKNDYFFQPGTVEASWDFVDTDLIEGRFQNPQGEVVSEGQGELDAEGGFSFQVPADVSEYPLSQVFTIDVEVTDINNQAVANRASAIVHKGNFYVGLRPQEYLGAVGEEMGVDVITVDTDGQPVADRTVDLSFYKRTWYNVREKREDGRFYWTSSYSDTLVSQTQVMTDQEGRAAAGFTPQEGGVHRAVAEATDSAGNEIRSATQFWVSTESFVSWRRENNDRIELVADKDEYAPGDVAEILVPAPFENSQALLTIERGGIREVRQLELEGNSETIQVPIASDYTPNVYASVMLVKGTGPNNALPQFKIGYVNLQVSAREKLLDVQVQPEEPGPFQPRDAVTYQVEVTDFQGRPVQTELSLALVDKAVLSLAEDTSPSLEQAFYGQRTLNVSTAASLMRSGDQFNQQLPEEGKGGGGAEEGGTVRRTFQDTAYWNPAVVTDENGRAEATVTLPDNLTTWNMKARGVTGADTLIGSGEVDIISTKDVLVRPVTPRFFTVGDDVQLETVVNNNTDQAVELDVSLETEGLAISGGASQPLSVPARGRAKVAWQVSVPSEGLNPPTAPEAYGDVLVRMSAEGSGYQDAIELTLPAYQFSSPEVVATAGQVDDTITEQIKPPADVDPSRGDLTVEVNPSLAAASLDSLEWLESFAYECSEQTVSKFLPNVATYQALQDLGLDRPSLRANLETQVAKELQRLYALQHSDGGWGWWLTDESRPWLTAYALYGMTVADRAGFAVDRGVMDRASQYLTDYLDEPVDAKVGYDLDQRAFIAYVLSERGSFPTSRTVTLYERRDAMSLYGKAFLALASGNVGGDQSSRIEGLMADFSGAAVLSATGTHWEEEEIDYWTMNTNTRTTAIVLMALARLDPENVNLPNAVRWLMVARREGHWETTQETAWSVLALTAFMESTGELRGQYDYSVELNGEVLKEGQVNQNNVDQAVEMTIPIRDLLLDVANELVISRDGTGKLYYTAHLRYFPPAAGLAPLDRGIVLGRQYFKVDPQTLQPTDEIAGSAQVGDVVQVKLTIIAPNDLHYLLVEDPLPAGFEAVDTSLRTASAAAQGPRFEEQVPEGEEVPWWRRFWWSYWTDSQLLDRKVALFATFLGSGTYEYTYLMRASVAGDFNVPPAHAEEMYFPEVFGRSSGGLFTVAPAE